MTNPWKVAHANPDAHRHTPERKPHAHKHTHTFTRRPQFWAPHFLHTGRPAGAVIEGGSCSSRWSKTARKLPQPKLKAHPKARAFCAWMGACYRYKGGGQAPPRSRAHQRTGTKKGREGRSAGRGPAPGSRPNQGPAERGGSSQAGSKAQAEGERENKGATKPEATTSHWRLRPNQHSPAAG